MNTKEDVENFQMHCKHLCAYGYPANRVDASCINRVFLTDRLLHKITSFSSKKMQGYEEINSYY